MIVTLQAFRVLVPWAAALLVISATLPARAQPVVLLDNLIDGTEPVGGYPIVGNAFGPGSQEFAIPFTTDNSAYLLTNVTLPLAQSGNPAVLLQIRTDSGGLPSDTILDSLLTSEIGSFPDFRVNWSPSSVSLSPNSTYWLSVLAGAPDTFRIWMWNNVDQTTDFAAMQGGAWFQASGTTPGARLVGVRLSSAAPEPGTLALVGMGFIGAGLFVRRRKFAA